MKHLSAAILLVLSFCSAVLGQTALRAGSAAPAFSGTSTNGTKYDLAALRGSVVVITFWSSRCYICQVEMPKLDRVIGQHDPAKVVFLALTMENEQKVAAHLLRNPMKVTVLPNSFGVVLQYADRDRNNNIDMGFPTFYVIDQRGTIRFRASGYDKTTEIDQVVAGLLTQ